MALPPDKINEGLDDLRRYLGARYVRWNGVWPPNQPVFYNGKGTPPSPQKVKEQGILCSGAVNLWEWLMDRTPNQETWGTLSIQSALVKKRPFFHGKAYPVGTILGYPFERDNDGHVVIVSTPPDKAGNQWTIGADVPLGLNESRTVRGAHEVFNFTYAGELPGVGVIPLAGDSNTTGVESLYRQLVRISENPAPRAYDLDGDAEVLAPVMAGAKINTRLRKAAFLATIIMETDRLKTLEEYGNEAYFRSFLGDQWRYHGRGYIMNTWKAAYVRLSKVLGVDLVNHPDKLSDTDNKELAAKAATWFWEKGNVTGASLNRFADEGRFKAISSIVNRGEVVPSGPINGWAARLYFYERALDVLPKDPEREPKPAPVPESEKPGPPYIEPTPSEPERPAEPKPEPAPEPAPKPPDETPVRTGAKRGSVEGLILFALAAFAEGVGDTPLPDEYAAWAPIVMWGSMVLIRTLEAYTLDRKPKNRRKNG